MIIEYIDSHTNPSAINPYECNPIPIKLTPNQENDVTIPDNTAKLIKPFTLHIPAKRA